MIFYFELLLLDESEHCEYQLHTAKCASCVRTTVSVEFLALLFPAGLKNRER